MKKKHLVWLLVFSLLIALPFFMVKSATAETARPPIKIAQIWPMTGPVAMVSKLLIEGVNLPFQEIGYEVAGRKIELIAADSGGNPRTSLDKVRKLVEHDKIDILIGPLINPNKMAIASYVKKRKVPTMTISPQPLKMPPDGWVFGAGGSDPQYPSAMAKYAFEELGYRKIVLFTTEGMGMGFFLPFKGTFEKMGGKVVQELFSPEGTPDFASYLGNLKDADALVAWFHGRDAITFLGQYHELNINNRLPLMAMFYGSFTSPYVLDHLPPKIASKMIGVITPASYDFFSETEINRVFKRKMKEVYNKSANHLYAEAYTGAMTVIQALKITGGDTTPEKVRKALFSLDFESPLGRINFDKKSSCILKDVYVVKIEKRGEKLDWSPPLHTYKQVPILGY